MNRAATALRVLILRARLRRRIEVSFDTQIGPGCRVIVAKGGIVRLHGATLSRSVTLEASANAVLEIGQSFIGVGSIVSARDRITIGNGSGIAEYVTVRDHNHVHDAETSLAAWEFSSAPIIVQDDVWIGSKATVVAGVTIEDHALCGAGAVITRDVKSWQRVGGVPARPIGTDVTRSGSSR